jgi:RNA polymerase sigma factor (sigma-70 family)
LEIVNGTQQIVLLEIRVTKFLDLEFANMDQPNDTPENSFTTLLQHLRTGDNDAAAILWDKFFKRMLIVARNKLAGAHRKIRDEEDIAVSAFKSFCLGLQNGRFEQNDSSSDLWPLLVSLTINKTIDHIRHENRQKRGGGRTINLTSSDEQDHRFALDELLHYENTPELQMVAEESMNRFFDALDATGDETLRTIAISRLEDRPQSEIARELGCTIRTLQRKLTTIRAIWQAIDA